MGFSRTRYYFCEVRARGKNIEPDSNAVGGARYTGSEKITAQCCAIKKLTSHLFHKSGKTSFYVIFCPSLQHGSRLDF